MNRKEFDALLVSNIASIEGLARRDASLLGIPREWQDIAADTLLFLLRSWCCFDAGKGSLLQWASSAIRNTAIKALRAKMQSALAVDCYTESAAFEEESGIEASQLLERLNQEARLFAQGYTYEEIADIVGVRSKTTIKNRIDRCAERIGVEMGIAKARGRRSGSTITRSQPAAKIAG